MRTITLEEHFVSRRFLDAVGEVDLGVGFRPMPSGQLADIGEGRLREMDDGAIDFQVISHMMFGHTDIPDGLRIELTRSANDELAAAVAAHPDRFAGFAILPMSDPEAAVEELARAVNVLGFKGAMIYGRTGGRFLDHPANFPVLELAASLGVPLYLHPNAPTDTLTNELYRGFTPEVENALGSMAWGWHAETGLHALRLIAAQVFDRLPNLQIIIGHMGEMIPAMLDRIDDTLTPPAARAGLLRTVAETFLEHFHVTTSGLFSAPPLILLLQTIGADRILFSVDYPFSPIAQARAFLDALAIETEEREKICHLNAERLLKIAPWS
jgi:uncharacterized protein